MMKMAALLLLLLATPVAAMQLTDAGKAPAGSTIGNFNYAFSDFGTLDSGTLSGSCFYSSDAQTVTRSTTVVDHFTCSQNPTMVIQDCGTTVPPTTTTCNAGTTLVTINPTTTGVTNDTLSATAIGAGHYVCGQVTAGTCAAIDWHLTLQGTRP